MIVSRLRAFPFAVLLLLLSERGFAQDTTEPYLFYHARSYGTERNFNPASMVINSVYGILQYDNRSRKIFDIDYANGFKNVIDNLSHPFYSISLYGWKNFINEDLIPGSISKKNAQYWPNYQNHLIGGGMSYVMVSEWYRYHGYPSPRLFGLGTMVVYYFGNEVVENGGYIGPNVDPLVDLMVFDPLSIVLWSISGVPEFFSQTLNMADWPNQPDYDPATQTIENHGENYSIKWKLPFTKRFSAFYYWGMTGLIGLSYRTGTDYNFSAGAGMRAVELVNVGDQSNGRKLTASMTWNFGAFYDRNNSLLASVFFSGVSDYRLHINVYPGLISIAGFSPGLFCAWGGPGKFVSGMNVSFLPIGIAAGVSE